MMSLRHLLDRSDVVRAILEMNLRSLIVLRPPGTILLPLGSMHTAVNTRVTRLRGILVSMITLRPPGARGFTDGRPRPLGTSAIIRPRPPFALGTTTISG